MDFRDHVARLRKEWRNAERRHPRAARTALFGFAVVMACWLAGAIWVFAGLYTGLPSGDAISRVSQMDQATTVYDASDQLAFTIFKEQRIEIPLEQMSPHLVQALLAIEDQRFYEHDGFDFIRIVSAAMANLRHLRAVQGGSTITQQLARQSFLTPDKTMRRKMQELILAARLERRYPKDKILELYLNKVYFGDGLYGVEAASRGFFGRNASDLTLAQAALLVGLVKSPSTYAPTVSLERALARRDVVIQAMLDNGDIDRETWEAARTERVVLRDALRVGEPYGQYFKEQVRRELVERFGWERVYQGGLHVYSTLDMGMQKAAEAAVASGLKALDRRTRRAADQGQAQLQAAMVAMDPVTGHVRAMVGGRDFRESSFNRAVQARRQPGSAFKPFVFAAALEAGYTPATMIRDLNSPIDTFQGAWTPEEEKAVSDEMSLRTALRISSNRAAVHLLDDVGIPSAVRYAKTMGVGDVPSVPSLALGSGEVTLQAMTAAYAAFANRGRVPQPLLIRHVEDGDGTVLFTTEPSSTPAVSEETAFLMTSMLADVVNAGTAARIRGLGFTLPAAGKTGTTNEFKDAWFVGFTPSLVAGVWVGFDQPRTIMRNAYASEVAVPMWTAFMKAATRRDEPRWFTPPRGVTSVAVCRLSGKRASGACHDAEMVSPDGVIDRRSTVYTEYFARGTAPTAVCDVHQPRSFFNTIASIFRGDAPPPPPPLEAAGIPIGTTPVVIAPVPSDDEEEAEEEPEPRRRGFWRRIFRIGGNEDQKQK
jgi:penicillin-binding protein 1A